MLLGVQLFDSAAQVDGGLTDGDGATKRTDHRDNDDGRM
jgi:hypothetical protein